MNKKQHQSRLREGEEEPKAVHEKSGWRYESGSKLNEAIVKTDLNLSPLKLKKHQQLTVLQKRKKAERARLLPNLMKSGMPTGEIVYSDEKMFTFEAQFNPQNDKVLARHSEDIPEDMLIIYRRQKPASIMVWAAVSKIWKSPLIFVKKCTKVNTNAYIDDILTPALHEMKKHFKNKEFIFQQDSAPSHTSNRSQEWCQVNFSRFWSKELWSPSSPDLNPIDFSV